MAKKLLSEAYQEFLDGQLNKRIQDYVSSRIDDTGKIIKEGVTQADIDDWIENGIKKSFYRDLNSVQGQIHYQQDFFKQLNKSRTPLNIGGKNYMLSGNMNYEWDPDTKLYSSKVSLHPLDIPEGDKVINYNLEDWIGSSKYNLEIPGIDAAYSSNLNKIINNPNISISDMTNNEIKQRWTDVRNSVKNGKTFEWSNSDEILGKPQKMIRLQQGKGSYRTSRPIREPKQVGPKRGDQFYNPKTKRQFVYDGPDDIVTGGHNLISDQGHVWLSYMDELEPGPGPGRNPLDYDTVKKYNDTLTEMSVLAADRDRRQYKDPEKYFEQLQNNIKDLKRYEREVKKQIKNHRMETGDYKRMKYLESQVDRYYKDNPDKQRKQLKRQEKKARKEVKKIEKQTDKELKKLEKKHQERKQVEAERKATEDSKNVSQPIDKEVTEPQTEGKTVEETIKNTSEVVQEKVDNVTDDIINADIENISIQAPNVMNDEYIKQAINNQTKNIEVGTAERFDTNETFEDFYEGIEQVRKERQKLEPERPEISPEVVKTEPPKPEIPDNENMSSQSTNPKKGYVDWMDDVYPESVSPIVMESDHIDVVRKWANATDEGLEDYIKTLENDYAPESIKFIKSDLYENRDRAKKILETRANAFTGPGVEQSSAHKNLYTKTSNTGVKSEMAKMPLSEDEIAKLVNNTAANVMNDLGIEEDFLVNTVFGQIEQAGLKGTSSIYDADINIDNIWASAQHKNRKRKIDEFRKQHPEMNEDEFTDWMFDHSELLNTTAEELAEEIQETVAHETRHYWQRTNKEAHEQMNGKHQGNFKSYEDYLNNELEIDARNYAKDYMERQKNINTNTSQQNMNSGNTKSNTNTTDNIDIDDLSPEEQARKILDENLEYQKNKNRFGNTEFSTDIDGGPMINSANMPNGANYNPNKYLDNGYQLKEIQSISDDGNTIITNSNYTNRTTVPPTGGGGGGKGPRGGGGNGGSGNGGGPTSPNNLTPNGPNGNGANKVASRLDELKNMGKFEMLMTAGNVLGAISDYKDARREGHGVVSSALKAGVNFAIEEALGNWSLLYHGAKWLPKGIIKGTEALYKENRKMNSAANVQVFGGAQFQDTQQLATMRQSGMEMAKMAQYNLQQTLMGQEATYLHR